MSDKFTILRRLLNQNSSYPYQTNLNPEEAFGFANWVAKNQVPVDLSQTSDYDMTGFYKDPNTQSSVSPIDNKLHFSDKYKTPYHETFSNESIYSEPNDPHWENSLLKDNNGVQAIELPSGVEKFQRLNRFK